MGRLGGLGFIFGGPAGQAIANSRSNSNSGNDHDEMDHKDFNTRNSPYENRILITFVVALFSIIFFLSAFFESNRSFYSSTLVYSLAINSVAWISLFVYNIYKDSRWYKHNG